jgi:hypothetical protein
VRSGSAEVAEENVTIVESLDDVSLFEHPEEKSSKMKSLLFTFTFTLIRHLGKTHNHRSRGDTPWRAQLKSLLSHRTVPDGAARTPPWQRAVR